jgi:hypothetical protein
MLNTQTQYSQILHLLQVALLCELTRGNLYLHELQLQLDHTAHGGWMGAQIQIHVIHAVHLLYAPGFRPFGMLRPPPPHHAPLIPAPRDGNIGHGLHEIPTTIREYSPPGR